MRPAQRAANEVAERMMRERDAALADAERLRSAAERLIEAWGLRVEGDEDEGQLEFEAALAELKGVLSDET